MSTVASQKKKLRAKEVQTKHFLRSFTHLFNPSCYHMYWCMWHNVKLHFKLQHILYTMELLTKISFRFLNLKLISSTMLTIVLLYRIYKEASMTDISTNISTSLTTGQFRTNVGISGILRHESMIMCKF